VDTRFPNAPRCCPSNQSHGGTHTLRFIARSAARENSWAVPPGFENTPPPVTRRTPQARPSRVLSGGRSEPVSGPAFQPFWVAKEGRSRGAVVDQEHFLTITTTPIRTRAAIQNAVRALRPEYRCSWGPDHVLLFGTKKARPSTRSVRLSGSHSFWAQATSYSTFAILGRASPKLPRAAAREQRGRPGDCVRHILAYNAPASIRIRLHAAADRDDPAAKFSARRRRIAQARAHFFPGIETYLGATVQSAPNSPRPHRGREWRRGFDSVRRHANASRLGKDTPRSDAGGRRAIGSRKRRPAAAPAKRRLDGRERSGTKHCIHALTQPQAASAAGHRNVHLHNATPATAS